MFESSLGILEKKISKINLDPDDILTVKALHSIPSTTHKQKMSG